MSSRSNGNDLTLQDLLKMWPDDRVMGTARITCYKVDVKGWYILYDSGRHHVFPGEIESDNSIIQFLPLWGPYPDYDTAKAKVAILALGYG